MKRRLVLLLLAVIICLNVSAIGEDIYTSEGYPIVNLPVTLTLLGCSATGQSDWNDMSLFHFMEEYTGVHLIIETVDETVFQQKLDVMVASGEYPDMILGGPLSDTDLNIYGSNGVLIPLNDLIDSYAPNIKSMFDTYPYLEKSLSNADGKIYSLYYLSDIPRGCQYCFWVNADWMDYTGYSRENLPATLDEFTQMLITFRDSDYNRNKKADEIPLEVREKDRLRALIMNAYGAVYNADGFYADEGQAVYMFTSDAFRDYLEYCAMLFSEKLLDNDIFTISSGQLETNSKANRVGVMDSPLPTTIYPVERDNEDITRYPMLNTLVGGSNTIPVKNKSDIVTRGLFSITSSCEYPQAAIRWIDYLYSYDGSMMMWQGAENHGYAYLDESRTLWRTLTPVGMGAEEFRRTQTPACGSVMPFAFFPGMLEGLTNPDEIYSDNEARAHMLELEEPFPMVSFTLEESMEISLINEDVSKYLKEMEAKFITGRLSLDDVSWEIYVDTMQSLGIVRLTEIYQEALDRYNARW